MTGPAILVSHGGEAFPDLDLVLEANGVRVIVVGNTKITKGITTTNFATTPDVPVTSITVNLPTGPHSALAANGNLCTSSLVMPTTITGAERQGDQTEHEDRRRQLPRDRSSGQKVVGNDRLPDGPDLLRRAHKRQRAEPGDRRPALGARQKTASLKVPLVKRRSRQGPSAEGDACASASSPRRRALPRRWHTRR